MSLWDSRAQRLLDYLGQPFKNSLTGLLGTFMLSLGRELAVGTESVTLTGSSDARGAGNFTVEVRFEPITAVTSVERVDSGGSVLETYTVVSYEDRSITVSGVTTPKAGDLLIVTYTYTHDGLEHRVTQALGELNVLTATGEFLDRWGRLFGVARLLTGQYGNTIYGTALYGGVGLESDSSYSRRIIATVTGGRNTKTAILAAVRQLTGGSPYIVEWSNHSGHSSFTFRITGDPAWMGEETEEATLHHLIWGRTARFVSDTAANGGAYTFEVWVPSSGGVTPSVLLTLVNSLKAAGTKAFIRYIP